MKNILKIDLYKIDNVNFEELLRYYNASILNVFADIDNKVNGTFAFHITPISSSYARIDDIANELKSNQRHRRVTSFLSDVHPNISHILN